MACSHALMAQPQPRPQTSRSTSAVRSCPSAEIQQSSHVHRISPVQTARESAPLCASTSLRSDDRHGPARTGSCAQGTPDAAARPSSRPYDVTRSRSTPSGPSDVHSAGPSAARTRASRRSENDATQMRSRAPVRRTVSTSGPIAGQSLTSTLTRTSGQAPRMSSRRGMAALPPIRMPSMSAAVSCRSRPRCSVTGRASGRGRRAGRRRSRVHVGLEVAYPSPTAYSTRHAVRSPIRRRHGARTPAAAVHPGTGTASAWPPVS